MVKNVFISAGDVRDSGSIPRSGRSPGEGNSKLLQYSCLENPMDRGGWWAIVNRVTRSQTQLKQLNTCIHTQTHKHTDTHNILLLISQNLKHCTYF